MSRIQATGLTGREGEIRAILGKYIFGRCRSWRGGAAEIDYVFADLARRYVLGRVVVDQKGERGKREDMGKLQDVSGRRVSTGRGDGGAKAVE